METQKPKFFSRLALFLTPLRYLNNEDTKYLVPKKKTCGPCGLFDELDVRLPLITFFKPNILYLVLMISGWIKNKYVLVWILQCNSLSIFFLVLVFKPGSYVGNTFVRNRIESACVYEMLHGMYNK